MKEDRVPGYGAVSLTCREIIDWKNEKRCGNKANQESIKAAHELKDDSQLRCNKHSAKSPRQKQ